MYIIAENIQILNKRVKEALSTKDADFFRAEISKLADAGADAIDLNIGPSKRNGVQVLPWLVKLAEEVTDLPLCFDTTNLAAIEAACQTVTKAQPIINSTDCKEERLVSVPPIAKKYGTRLIGLTMAEGLIPVSADERVGLAIEKLIPALVELDFPISDLLVDPLAMTVSGCQEYCPECVNAVQMIKFAWEPAPWTNAGLSNVSNRVPRPMRPLINQVYLVMLMGAGIDCVIADPLDEGLNEFIRVVEERDESSGANRLMLTVHDKVAGMEDLEVDDVDMSDPQQVDIWKTYQVLTNKVIYTDAYLR